MSKLTKRQAEVLAYIRQHGIDHGYAPTLREIGDAFGMKSLGSVYKHLTSLERGGHLRREFNQSRSMKVVMNQNDPTLIYYGPHACAECFSDLPAGMPKPAVMIVKAAREQGGAEFDAPDGPIYPNTIWTPHVHRFERDLKLYEEIAAPTTEG